MSRSGHRYKEAPVRELVTRCLFATVYCASLLHRALNTHNITTANGLTCALPGTQPIRKGDRPGKPHLLKSPSLFCSIFTASKVLFSFSRASTCRNIQLSLVRQSLPSPTSSQSHRDPRYSTAAAKQLDTVLINLTVGPNNIRRRSVFFFFHL
jgi:hypothetical protein